MEEIDTPVRESMREREGGELVEQIVNRMAEMQVRKKEFKPPTYNGDTDIELFLRQFQDVALVNRWEPVETLLHLRSCLLGNAAECGRETTVQATYESLRARFGLTPKQAREQLKTLRKRSKQSYHELGSEITRLAYIAHPKQDEEFLQETILETYMTAISNVPLRLHLMAKPHDTLTEAVRISNDFVRAHESKSSLAAITEDNSASNPISDYQTTGTIQDQINALKQTIQELIRNMPHQPDRQREAPNNQQRQRTTKPGPCYYCKGEHWKRNCPHLAQRSNQYPSYSAPRPIPVNQNFTAPNPPMADSYQYQQTQEAMSPQPIMYTEPHPAPQTLVTQQPENCQGLVQ